MESSIFGKNITYYDEMSNFSGLLAELIKKEGFEDFNPRGISSYFTYRYPIGDLTMFNGFKKIPCGYKLEGRDLKSYWHPKFEEKPIPFDQAKKKTEKLLLNTVAELSKGKRIAIPVSGGIDSSLIVALCRKLYPDEEIFTYSAGFYGDDEFEYSRLVAKEFKTVHKEIVLYKEDFIGDESLLRPLIAHKAEPLHPNEIALGYLERIAKKDGCDIALCGEGGDDIFGGYGQILRMYMNYKSDIPYYQFFLDNYRYFLVEDVKKIVKPKYFVDDYVILQEVLKEEEIPQKIENKVFYFVQKVHTIGLITRGANAMRFNGLELGFPYTDFELVNYVNLLPFDYKVRWKSENDKQKAQGLHFRDLSELHDIPKYIIKKIAEDYLPYRIIYRPKVGFPVPFDFWFQDLEKWALDDEIFRIKSLEGFNGWKKFMIINLNTFIEEFRHFQR